MSDPIEKSQQIKMVLIGLAEFYQTDLTPGQLQMYCEDLEDLDLKYLAVAIKRIRLNPLITRFPLPAIIRQEIMGNAKDEALEASNRIIEALSRYGYTNPARAKDFIGELGWHVVKREGGWEQVCRTVSEDNIGMFKAQWRELAAATLRRGGVGLHDEAPRLQHKNENDLFHIGNLLPERKDEP